MAVLSLLVEDDATARKYQRKELERAGFIVIEAATYSEALNAYRSVPAFDLAVCDVNLDRSDQWNRAGIDVASELRANDETLPIVGYSSILAEEDWSDTGLFSFVVPAGVDRAERRRQVQQWLESAETHRAERLRQSQQRLDSYRSAGRTVMRHRPDILSRFSDPVLDKLGYILKIIEPGTKQLCLSGEKRTIAHPTPIWLQHTDGVVIAELYRFPLLFGVGNTEDEAINQLFFLLDGYLEDFEKNAAEGAADSPLTKAIHDYLKKILSPNG